MTKGKCKQAIAGFNGNRQQFSKGTEDELLGHIQKRKGLAREVFKNEPETTGNPGAYC